MRLSARGENGAGEMTIPDCLPTRVNDLRLPDRSLPSVAALCSLITTGALP